MEHASTSGDVRHRQSKAFKQRLAYWLKKDLPYEEALRRAELRNQINEPLKLVSAPTDGIENLAGRKPGRTKIWRDENLIVRNASDNPHFNPKSDAPGPKAGRSALLSFSYSSITPNLTMNFDQPCLLNGRTGDQLSLSSEQRPWRDFGLKFFWLVFATSCLMFLIYGNLLRMDGPLPERIFKATFGEILVFGAGLMAFKCMMDQAQKIFMGLSGIGVSLFLTHATLTSAHKKASDDRHAAERSLSSETQVRDSLVTNLSEISPNRIKRAEEVREKIAASTAKIEVTQKVLRSMPSADHASYRVDLFIRLIAQLSLIISLSQFRKAEETV